MTGRLEAWYIGKRDTHGSSTIQEKRSPFENELDSLDIKSGSFGKVYMFRDGRELVMKKVYSNVGCQEIDQTWYFKMPQDAYIPYKMRTMKFNYLLDVSTMNDVSICVYDNQEKYVSTLYVASLDQVMSTNNPICRLSLKNTEWEEWMKITAAEMNAPNNNNTVRANFSILMDKLPYSLRQMNREGRLDSVMIPSIIKSVYNQMKEAYEKLHVVYTDMNIANVMLDSNYNAYLIDFGSFFTIGESCVQTYTIPIDIKGNPIPDGVSSYTTNEMYGIWSLFILIHLLTNQSHLNRRLHKNNTNHEKYELWEKHIGAHKSVLFAKIQSNDDYVKRMEYYIIHVVSPMFGPETILPLPQVAPAQPTDFDIMALLDDPIFDGPLPHALEQNHNDIIQPQSVAYEESALDSQIPQTTAAQNPLVDIPNSSLSNRVAMISDAQWWADYFLPGE